MATPLIEQQIYLLERYITPEYFKLLRDSFHKMVLAGYAALDEFMRHLPPDYRSRDLSDQPDITWGERVLPNLTETDDLLAAYYERLLAGDYEALSIAGGVRSDFKGMREFKDDWLPEPHQTEFFAQLSIAGKVKEGIEHAYNRTGCYLTLYYPNWGKEQENWDVYWDILPPPKTWPIYRLNNEVQVKTDEIVPRTGIYLPTVSKSCPEFMIEGTEAWEANVDRYPNESSQPATWILVERVADEGGPEPGKELWRQPSGKQWRCEANQRCPQDGYWWSYAAPDRRGWRHFRAGEIMPAFQHSTYGGTVWYMNEGDEDK